VLGIVVAMWTAGTGCTSQFEWRFKLANWGWKGLRTCVQRVFRKKVQIKMETNRSWSQLPN